MHDFPSWRSSHQRPPFHVPCSFAASAWSRCAFGGLQPWPRGQRRAGGGSWGGGGGALAEGELGAGAAPPPIRLLAMSPVAATERGAAGQAGTGAWRGRPPPCRSGRRPWGRPSATTAGSAGGRARGDTPRSGPARPRWPARGLDAGAAGRHAPPSGTGPGPRGPGPPPAR